MSEEKATSKRGKSLEDPKDAAFSPSSLHSSLTLGQPLLLEAPRLAEVTGGKALAWSQKMSRHKCPSLLPRGQMLLTDVLLRVSLLMPGKPEAACSKRIRRCTQACSVQHDALGMAGQDISAAGSR